MVMASDTRGPRNWAAGRLERDRRALRSRIVAAAISVVLVATVASADQLVLKNGNTLEGRVRELAGGDYELTIDDGKTVILDRRDVARKIVSEAPLDELARRLAALDEDDRDGLIELAAWAEFKGLRKASETVYRRILRLDPHHAGARDRLGYALYRNRWHRRSELKSLGLVRHDGVWMTKDEVSAAKQRTVELEFENQLRDLHHENKFIRENAILQLLDNHDERLVPALLKQLGSSDPLNRMVCGRVLANQPWERTAEPLYRALLVERRQEVATSWIASLGAYRDVRLAAWVARDLSHIAHENADPGDPSQRETRIRRLLQLAEACPHRATVPALCEIVDEAGWGRVAHRLLGKLLGVRDVAADRIAWQRYWRLNSDAFGPDLNSGWLSKKRH